MNGFLERGLFIEMNMQNHLEPRIENIEGRKLIGQRRTMSYADYTISELWRSFLSNRQDISNSVSDEVISLVNYSKTHFIDFKPTNQFERWAAVEVSSYHHVPPNMETFDLPGGLYAVFDHKGFSNDPAIFQYIFSTWIPKSAYTLDHRPHFEVLGAKYENNDPNSEEQLWIPIKKRIR